MARSKRTALLRNLLAAVALGLVALTPANAQETQADAVWTCWYNQDWRIQCVLESANPDATVDPRYANNTMLPQAIKAIWTSAATLGGSRVFIPLYNEPEDWDRVRLLAESVMCGANRACVVNFSQSFIEAAMLDPSLQP